MLYSTTLYLLAGTVTGSIFRVPTLLILLGIILIESVILALVHGNIAGLWAIAGLLAAEVGYLTGIYSRRALEQAGYWFRSV